MLHKNSSIAHNEILLHYWNFIIKCKYSDIVACEHGHKYTHIYMVSTQMSITPIHTLTQQHNELLVANSACEHIHIVTVG